MNRNIHTAALGILAFFSACQPGPELTPDAGPSARIRVVHLSPDAPSVDVYAGGTTPLIKSLGFLTGTDSARVPTGRAELKVTANGAPVSSAVATLSNVLLEQDRDYTAFAFGKLANLQLNSVENSTQGLASSSVRVRVVHAADGVGPVNVFQVPSSGVPSTLISNLRYGTAAAPLDLPSAALVIGLDVNADNTPDLLFDVPALPKGTVVNVFAVLEPDGNPVLFAQLTGSTTARLAPKLAQLRVLHLSPNAPPVKAFVDGAVPAAFPQLAFGQSTPYTSLSAANHSLDISADNTVAGAVLRVAQLSLGGGQKYTAVAIGNLPTLQALSFENGGTGLAAGNIRVRAIHAAPAVGPVDVFSVPAMGAPTEIVSNVAFGGVSSPLDLPAGAYTLGVDLNNDANPELYFELPSLPGGTVANVFVTQDPTGAVFALAQLDGDMVARIEPSTSKVRVVHLSRNAPNVDVYANGVKAVNSLAYASTTMALTVKSGATDFAVTATGAPIASAVLRVPGARLLPGRSYTVVAYGDLANIAAALLEDDARGLNASTDIRLRITHVATTVTRGDVYAVRPAGNTLLVPNIGFGETKPAFDLASNSYTVGFDAEANGTIDIAFDLPVLAPGSFANVFVATDAANLVYLLVQTTGAGALRVNPR